MSQAELDREVAHLTGESVGFIRSMGFSHLNMPYQPRPRKCASQTAAIRILKAQKIESAEQVLRKAA